MQQELDPREIGHKEPASNATENQQVYRLPMELTWLIDPNQPHGYQKMRVDDTVDRPRYDVLNNEIHQPNTE